MPKARRRAAGRRRGPWIAIAGARPNYVKLAPLVRAAARAGRRLDWIDTGQHTAAALTSTMMRDLGLPRPVTRLVAPAAGTRRIAALATSIGTELEKRGPSLVVVVGDVDSTLAGALAAWRLDLPLVHVEAGLRAYEPDMPEECNRILVDALSDRLYLSEPQAVDNLRREGVSLARIRKPGNVMADALLQHRERIEAAAAQHARAQGPEPFLVATLHRQANVDDPRRLAAYVNALERIGRERPVLFPVHPRTRARLSEAGADPARWRGGLRALDPLGYLAFLGLVSAASGVITDSGGLQVEAALLGVPCVTARRRTEHQLTLTHASNVIAGTDPRRLPSAVHRALAQGAPPMQRPRAWDGRAAERMVAAWRTGFDRPPRLESPDDRLLESAGAL